MTDTVDLAPPDLSNFKQWVDKEIEQLSVSTLKSNAVTCTACGKIEGTYIIDYQEKTFRLPAAEAYAFLKFVDENS
ncbi:hypothetical protein [Synechococcus sp. PCC 7336]|uniref:hypothetical protein n=1 Tax=Synechococcus sp. PCC 7336 TaxID=195250 RepID=UPI0003449AF2|nr:hypothetical protein [Synechococcus sp. PCC 7336]